MATVTKHRQNNDQLYDIHKTKYTFFSRAMMEILQIFYHHYYLYILMITHILIIQNFAKHFILNIITTNIILISIILYYIDNIEYRRNINLSPSHPPSPRLPFLPPTSLLPDWWPPCWLDCMWWCHVFQQKRSSCTWTQCADSQVTSDSHPQYLGFTFKTLTQAILSRVHYRYIYSFFIYLSNL